MASKPLVGIAPSMDPGERIRKGVEYLYLKRDYSLALAEAGATPVILPPDAAVAEALALCDALVLPGGEDLPRSFGAHEKASGPEVRPEVAARIARDRELLEAFLAARKPVLGICYGMQLLNLHLGGTLHVDIRAHDPAALDHGGTGRTTEHEIELPADSSLGSALGAQVRVSSSHHQAVDAVAPGLRVAARAPDGVVEAVEGPGMLGVEWHPESDATAERVYGHFVGRLCGSSTAR